MKIGDTVESTDWREQGKQRVVTDIPGKGHIDHGYCYLQTPGYNYSTRVRLRKNGLPERYRLANEE